MQTTESPTPGATAIPSLRLGNPVLSALDAAVGKLRFGVVQLTIHEGRVVQLEVTEKHRF